jgi:hypothetical protein
MSRLDTYVLSIDTFIREMYSYIALGEILMTTVAEIQSAVRALPEQQFGVFSSWFYNYEEEHWDRQIECDHKSKRWAPVARSAKEAPPASRERVST